MNPANVAATATTEHLGWLVMARAYSAQTMTAGAGNRPERAAEHCRNSRSAGTANE